MTIPLFKVFMAPGAKDEVAKVLDSGYIGQGPKVDEFEAALSTYLDAPHIITLNSGTSAIDLALHLCGVGPGDEVITTPQTCTATNSGIVHRGATIVWADVNARTGNIIPSDVASKITKKTKAIIAVDWAGRPCEYDALREISEGIPIIEDAAHAFGAIYEDEHIAQSGGDYVCWSFQAIKHLTTGDGGALQTPKDVVERARLLRWYGLDRKSSKSFRCEQNIDELGYKYHMNDIAAAIGLANLRHMNSILEQHRMNSAFYDEAFSVIENGADALLPACSETKSSCWLYTLLVKDRASFQAVMADKGIETSEVHRRNDKHTAFEKNAKFVFGHGTPNLDYFAAHQVSIPCGWWVSKEQREYIANAVIEWTRR